MYTKCQRLMCSHVTGIGGFGHIQDLEDDDGVQDEKEIWEVTHVSEQDLETTEVEGVDSLSELLELTG